MKEVSENKGVLPKSFWEHVRASRRASRESWKYVLPERFWELRREARREMLLAARSIVDAALDRLEEKPEVTSERVRVKPKVEPPEAAVAEA